MSTSRWWIAVYYAGTIATAVIVAFVGSSFPGGTWLAFAVLAVLAILFPILAWPVLRDDRSGASFAILLIIGLTVGTTGNSQFLIFQMVLMPMLWMLVGARRAAIAANVVAALGGWFGFTAGEGFTATAAASGVLIQVIALGFSICMGVWISHVVETGIERGRLLDQLRATQGELETLHRNAGAAQERERIARELHDTIAQNLTSIVMVAERSRRRLADAGEAVGAGDTTGATLSAATDVSLELIESTARDALAEARSLVAATARVPADGSTLAETIARLAERFRRETEIDVRVAVEPVAVPRDLEVVLLRCVQEGLANVRKHARAHTASVRLETRENEVVLTVTDDGVGLGGYSEGTERGFGLGGMRDRVGLVGGTVELAGAERDGAEGDRADEGGGARLCVRLPLREEGRA